MTEVRAEIDRVDKALVDTIAERFGYVERAWQLKLEARQEANVPWRNQQVIDKVHRYHQKLGHSVLHLHADAAGLTDAQHRAALELFRSDSALDAI